MEQIRQRARHDGADLEELPLIPAPRRGPAFADRTVPLDRSASEDRTIPLDRAAVVERTGISDGIAVTERDDEVDTDLFDEHDVLVEPEAADTLTERDRHILAFEKQWWRHAGAKEQAIRDQFDLSATRYYQLLNALLDNPAALELDPILVGRLRRLRGSRARARTSR
jgi:hypothetical protein